MQYIITQLSRQLHFHEVAFVNGRLKREDIPFDLQAYAYHVCDWKTEEGCKSFAQKIRELQPLISNVDGGDIDYHADCIVNWGKESRRGKAYLIAITGNLDVTGGDRICPLLKFADRRIKDSADIS
jgi:hypothetical protein